MRVDLAGKTVIPALVDAHSHIGYMRNLTSGAARTTRARTSWTTCIGLRISAWPLARRWDRDFGELPFQMREESAPERIRMRRDS